ncbi:hypothetical protein GCM10029992_10530 [Glycomyces albus]
MPGWPRTIHLHQRWTITERVEGARVLILIKSVDDRPLPHPGIHLIEGPTGDQVTVQAASRTRWLVPEPEARANGSGRDNFAFAAWVVAHAARLAELGPGAHRGVWFGAGIGHGYGMAERHLALTDIARWSAAKLPTGLPETVVRVPVLTECTGQDLSEAIGAGLARLTERGSILVPGEATAGVQAHSAADPRFVIDAALNEQ